MKNDPEMFFHATVPFNFSETFITENTEFFEVAIDRYKLLDLPPFIYLLDAFQKLQVTERLFEITVPTLIIAGKKDILKPPGAWDRFSMYLTIGDDHIRELESLVLRIVRPKGNKQIGKFKRAEDLRRALRREARQRSLKEIDELFPRKMIGKSAKATALSSCRNLPGKYV